MVSNWRFWSAKEITTGGRHPFQLVAVIAFIGALIVLYSEYMLIILAMAYLVSGCRSAAGVFVEPGAASFECCGSAIAFGASNTDRALWA